MLRSCLTALAGLLLPVVVPAGEKPPPPIILSVHSEAEARDSEKFARPIPLQYARRTAYISTSPDLTSRDIFDVMPFAAPDGTQGAHLRLSPGGRIRLEGISGAKLGKALVVFVGGRQIADLYIDRRIEDGILPIPSGLTPADIEGLRRTAEANRRKE